MHFCVYLYYLMPIWITTLLGCILICYFMYYLQKFVLSFIFKFKLKLGHKLLLQCLKLNRFYSISKQESTISIKVTQYYSKNSVWNWLCSLMCSANGSRACGREDATDSGSPHQTSNQSTDIVHNQTKGK